MMSMAAIAARRIDTKFCSALAIINQIEINFYYIKQKIYCIAK